MTTRGAAAFVVGGVVAIIGLVLLTRFVVSDSVTYIAKQVDSAEQARQQKSAPPIPVGGPGTAGPSAPAAPAEFEVEIRVEGPSTSAKVRYTDPAGEKDAGVVTLPWKQKVVAKRGERLAVTAENQTGGEMSVEIVAAERGPDGKVSEAVVPLARSSGGSYATVTCDAVVGK